MRRSVSPELLDELPANDPRAIRSRKDLLRLNMIMGHARVISRSLLQAGAGKRFDQLVDLGAGDGRFALRVARHLAPKSGPMRIVLVDRLNLVSEQTRRDFTAIGWASENVTGDVFKWLLSFEASRPSGIFANLFLHHFTDVQLQTILRHVAEHSVCLIACDPRRSFPVLIASRLLGFIGCNSVTRQDAILSVKAGFKGSDLSPLWPELKQREILEREVGPFSHLFAVASHPF